MQVVNALFWQEKEAEHYFQVLRDAGIPDRQIFIFGSKDTDRVASHLYRRRNLSGIFLGTLLGCIGGGVVAFGLNLIPHKNMHQTWNWLLYIIFGIVLGAGFGGIIGNMQQMMRKSGVPKAEARLCMAAVERGAWLLSVASHDKDAKKSHEILKDFIPPLAVNAQKNEKLVQTRRAFAKYEADLTPFTDV